MQQSEGQLLLNADIIPGFVLEEEIGHGINSPSSSDSKRALPEFVYPALWPHPLAQVIK